MFFVCSERHLSNILKNSEDLGQHNNLPGLDYDSLNLVESNKYLFQLFLCHLSCSLQQVDQLRRVTSQQLDFGRKYYSAPSRFFSDRYLTMLYRIFYSIINSSPTDSVARTIEYFRRCKNTSSLVASLAGTCVHCVSSFSSSHLYIGFNFI